MDPVLRAFDEPTPSTHSSERNENALHDITNGSPNRSKSAKENAGVNAKRALKGPGGIKTECVRVQCRARDQTQTRIPAHTPVIGSLEQNVYDENEEDADGSEMIWWSWAGKLEGFADW